MRSTYLKLNKQVVLITLILSCLSSPQAIGMDQKLAPQPATDQLPTPGMYQTESDKGPVLIYVSETILEGMGPEVFKGLKRVGDPVETSPETTTTQKQVDPKIVLEVFDWVNKHYPSKKYDMMSDLLKYYQ